MVVRTTLFEMDIMIPAAFQPFLDQAPLCVLARAVLERLFLPARLDQLFRESARRQYEHDLLFSQVAELMLSVALQTEPSVHAAYKKRAAELPVSDQAIYDKLRCMELGVSAALVRDSAEQVGPVIRALGAAAPPLLAGYRTRVIDGNHLGATERRLKPLRRTWAAALPGKVLAVYDQELDVVSHVFLTPDGHAQERSLFDEVLPEVRADDLWIADRNFCTLGLLAGVIAAEAAFVIRQHGQLHGQLLGERQFIGRSETGAVSEQGVEFEHGDRVLRLRRVSVVLDKPTRDGDTEVHVLTNLPRSAADGVIVAELYRQRWTIEARFYEVAQTLNCAPNTLAYPKAALFAFCLALVASNAVALLKAALRSVHAADDVAAMSSFYMAEEVRTTFAGMMIVLPATAWAAFGRSPVRRFAKALRDMARRVNPHKYYKAKRGPKRPPPPKARYRNGGHVSTHRLLEQHKRRQ
jgi:Transposase DDE domain